MKDFIFLCIVIAVIAVGIGCAMILGLEYFIILFALAPVTVAYTLFCD